MTIKLVVINLENTLLNNKNKIYKSTKISIQKLIEKKINVIITSSQCFEKINKYLIKLNLKNNKNFCITNNGAYIQNNNTQKCIYQKNLNIKDYTIFEKISNTYNLYFHAFTKKYLYTPNKNISRYTIYESYNLEHPIKFRKSKNIKKNKKFYKFMLINEPEILQNYIKKIPKKIFTKYKFCNPSTFYIEIFHKKTNKGKALKFLSNYLKIKRKKIMSIGSEINDIPIIKFSGIGIAMDNSIKKIKKISQYITKNNIENGVNIAIKKFLLKI